MLSPPPLIGWAASWQARAQLETRMVHASVPVPVSVSRTQQQLQQQVEAGHRRWRHSPPWPHPALFPLHARPSPRRGVPVLVLLWLKILSVIPRYCVGYESYPRSAQVVLSSSSCCCHLLDLFDFDSCRVDSIHAQARARATSRYRRYLPPLPPSSTGTRPALATQPVKFFSVPLWTFLPCSRPASTDQIICAHTKRPLVLMGSPVHP